MEDLTALSPSSFQPFSSVKHSETKKAMYKLCFEPLIGRHEVHQLMHKGGHVCQETPFDPINKDLFFEYILGKRLSRVVAYSSCFKKQVLADILEQYHRLSGKRLWDAKHENLSNEVDRIKKENDSLQNKLRQLKGEDITSLTHRELIALEDALEHGLSYVRNQESEVVKTHRRSQKMLEEENKELNFILQHRQMAMAAAENAKEVEEYYKRLRDYGSQSQDPFPFRVQPFQPNLQDRI
ncbi:hypothetical protein SAY87_006331 [Trapa incisa]|uniref:K-box domain-containing protein n=1 Tax=Trapa incisa TaxID=236973 RepID=A0AAN7JZA4_9MYRT|nr:hypothetical protein SAY87_006331 [Trapa incisa]